MSDPEQEPSTSQNNLFSWISKLAEAFNHPYITNNYAPLLTNLSILVAFLSGGGGLAFYISQITQKSETPPSSQTDTKTIEIPIKTYTEQPIKINSACNDKDILNISRGDLGVSEGADIIATAELSSSTELWPVFRWKCNFKTKLNNEQGEFLRVKEVSFGIDLHKYCKLKYNDAWYASHKDYEDPNSWYCTIVHYEGDDEDNSLNDNAGKQNK